MRGLDYNDRAMAFAIDGALQPLPDPPSLQSLPHAEDGLWIAVPAQIPPQTLGEVLRRLRTAGQSTQGFADRATLLAAWLQLPGSLAVLDLTRQQLSISVVESDAGAAALRRTVLLPGGEQALHTAWLNLAAGTVVRQTRFDPLHDQQQEAQLRRKLPALAAEAQLTGQGQCLIEFGASSFTLTLTRDQLVAASSDWLQPFATALQSISAATADASLLVPDALLGIPGINDILAAARFTRVYRMPDGLAAAAASLQAPVTVPSSGAVNYLTRVTLSASAAGTGEVTPLLLDDRQPTAMATHVVYRGRAIPITEQGLVIGRDPGPAMALRLPEGIAGLSRQHCTLQRDANRVQVIDHSTYGSFIDGVRVRGRALLAAGSILRLGQPGIELPLVALDSAAGPQA